MSPSNMLKEAQGWWPTINEVFKSGQVGTIVGTILLVIISGQYLGFIASPITATHTMQTRTIEANSALLMTNNKLIEHTVTNQTQMISNQLELIRGIWALYCKNPGSDAERQLCLTKTYPFVGSGGS